MPNADEAALAKYRLNKAEDCLSAAKLLLQDNLYADSANRSYYAIFHAINALFALRSIGFKKHAGVLANFNTDYIKTGIFEIEYAKIAKSAFFRADIQRLFGFLYCVQTRYGRTV